MYTVGPIDYGPPYIVYGGGVVGDGYDVVFVGVGGWWSLWRCWWWWWLWLLLAHGFGISTHRKRYEHPMSVLILHPINTKDIRYKICGRQLLYES